MADDAFGIDDEGSAQGNAGALFENAKFGRQFALNVRQPREGQRLQVGVMGAPSGMDEIAIGRRADQHGIAIREILFQAAVADDLGRADEGEILRPEEHDQPLTGIGFVGNLREIGLVVRAGHGGQVEFREAIANGQHCEHLLFG